MYASGGPTILWKKLDERFPLKPRMDEKGEVLDAVFSLAPLTSEQTGGYIGRVKAVFARCTPVIIVCRAFCGRLQVALRGIVGAVSSPAGTK